MIIARKIISMLLVFALLYSYVPVDALASAIGEEPGDNEIQSTEPEKRM